MVLVQIPVLVKIHEPLNSHPYTVYSTSKNITVNGWESLKTYKVAYSRGWKVLDINLNSFHFNLYVLNSAEMGLLFMSTGTADIFINIPFIVDPLLNKRDIEK